MKKSIVLIITTVLLIQINKGTAQNNASPYSVIGIGDIEKSSFDRTSGMGHAGMALFSNRFLYNSNPASYSALDDKFFNIEVASRFKTINYSGSPISSVSSQSSDLQFKKLIIAMKIKPKWGAAIGLLPFSTANYSFYSTKTLLGSLYTLPVYYQGTGSVNQFFFSNSYKVNKHFSVGLQASYLFGQLNQNETINVSVSDSVLNTSRKISIGTPMIKPGFQYNTMLSKKVKLFVGGTASIKTQLDKNYTLQVTDGNTVLPVSDNNNRTEQFTLPTKFDGSVATTIKDAFTLAVDYSFQNWDNLNYSKLGYKLVNSNHFGAGFEYSHKKHFRDVSFERHFYQAGFFYNNGYLKVNGQQINDVGFTLGAGLNSVRNNLGLQLNLEVGRRGTTNVGLIEENYYQATLIISYRDFWFVKVKQYD